MIGSYVTLAIWMNLLTDVAIKNVNIDSHRLVPTGRNFSFTIIGEFTCLTT